MLADVNIDKYLGSMHNVLASCFCATANNYQSVLDRYFFIGLIERGQESIDVLAELLGKKKVEIPHMNVSTKREEAESESISMGVRKEFYENNILDYKIYEYCAIKLDESIDCILQ